jgi:hypothetical protein
VSVFEGILFGLLVIIGFSFLVAFEAGVVYVAYSAYSGAETMFGQIGRPAIVVAVGHFVLAVLASLFMH